MNAQPIVSRVAAGAVRRLAPAAGLGLLAAVVLAGTGCGTNDGAPVAAGPQGQDIVRRNGVPAVLPDPIDLGAPGAVARTTVRPTVIDTRAAVPQVQVRGPFDGVPTSTATFRPPTVDPTVPDGPPNDLRAGTTLDEPRAEPGALFPGIEQTPWSPPDPSIAVGPDHVVETVNMAIAFYAKDGTLEFSQNLDSTGSPGFFEDIGGGDFTFDPKCFYDHVSERYLVLALEVYQSTDESWITLAVSDDSNPHGVWYKYRTWSVVTDGATGWWIDYPGLGFDENGYYVTGNLFNLFGPGGFGGVLFRSYDKTPMLTGDPAVFTDIRDADGASVQVAQSFGSPAAPFFVSRGSSTSLRVQAITDPLGSPTLETANVTVPSYSGPGSNAPNLNGGSIDTLDGRLMNVHWRNGNLYACHGINGGGGTQARWYQIKTGNWPTSGSPFLDQSGDIAGPSGVHVFFPAIYSNQFDAVAMVVAQSSSSAYASVQATGRLPGDPSGAMGALTELTIGSAGSSGRWGDYFDIAIDPTDDSTFWMVGEYAGPNGWQTWIGTFTLDAPCPADIAGTPGVDIEDLLALLANWGSNGPGAAIAAPTDVVDIADLLGLLAAWGTCP